MKDPILKEIERSMAQSSPGNWFTTPANPGEPHVIHSSTPGGGSKALARVHSEADAHLLTHAKDYITHLLNLLERQSDTR